MEQVLCSSELGIWVAIAKNDYVATDSEILQLGHLIGGLVRMAIRAKKHVTITPAGDETCWFGWISLNLFAQMVM